MNDQLTLEYIFFHEEPYRQFKQFLAVKEVPLLKVTDDHTNVEGRVVFIEDNLDEVLSDEIEAYYDDMMALNESLVASEAGSEEMNMMGLALSLQDGRSVLAAVDPDVLNRILTIITQQELGQLVDDIVNAVENPDGLPLCKRD